LLLIACPAVITGIWAGVFAVRSQKKSVQVCVILLQLIIIIKYCALLLAIYCPFDQDGVHKKTMRWKSAYDSNNNIAPGCV